MKPSSKMIWKKSSKRQKKDKELILKLTFKINIPKRMVWSFRPVENVRMEATLIPGIDLVIQYWNNGTVKAAYVINI